MNSHIVRVNEKIEKIALLYNLTVEEIISCNHHIKDWNHLIPGTKLKLPEIPEIVRNELDNTEPFIEEYYPQIDVQSILSKNIQEEIYNKPNINVVNKNEEQIVQEIPVVSSVNEEENAETVKTSCNNKNHQYSHNKEYKNPYYGYYNPNNGFYNPYYGFYPNSRFGYYRSKKKKNNSRNEN